MRYGEQRYRQMNQQCVAGCMDGYMYTIAQTNHVLSERQTHQQRISFTEIQTMRYGEHIDRVKHCCLYRCVFCKYTIAKTNNVLSKTENP